MESIACAISSAERLAVPLNSMCSTKCAMPPRSADSWREPRVSHTPMLIDRTCVIFSVRRRSPLSRTSRTIGTFKVKLAVERVSRARRRAVKYDVTILAPQAPRNEGYAVATTERRPDLADLERPALEAALEERGHARFHARQIFRWIYRHGVTDAGAMTRSEEHTSELQSRLHLVCRLLLEK